MTNIFEQMLPWNNPNPIERVEYVDDSAERERLANMLNKSQNDMVHQLKRYRESIIMAASLKKVIEHLVYHMSNDPNKTVKELNAYYAKVKDENYRKYKEQFELNEADIEKNYNNEDSGVVVPKNSPIFTNSNF